MIVEKSISRDEAHWPEYHIGAARFVDDPSFFSRADRYCF